MLSLSLGISTFLFIVFSDESDLVTYLHLIGCLDLILFLHGVDFFYKLGGQVSKDEEMTKESTCGTLPPNRMLDSAILERFLMTYPEH